MIFAFIGFTIDENYGLCRFHEKFGLIVDIKDVMTLNGDFNFFSI